MKIYRVKTSFVAGNSIILIFPILLSVVTYFEGESVAEDAWLGVIIFWVLGLLITFSPLLARLEVGDNYIQSTFIFKQRKITPEIVKNVSFGKFMRGGLGYGNAINFNVSNNRKYIPHSISEKMYGKEAIEHVMQVLNNKS